MVQKLNEEMIRYIISNLGDAVFVTDRFGVLLFSNPAAESLFGLSSDQETKHKIWEYIPFVETNDDLIQLFIEAIDTRQPARQMLVLYENNHGKIFHFRISLSFKEEYGGLFLIIISDLTEFIKVTDAFSRFTSPQIADYVLHTPEGAVTGGENRDVTILMSDLRGFTAMSAIMPAKPLVDMLNHYFGIMVEIISSFQGTVIEFLGDGIFVVFGAPSGDPLHAAHAVSCAIEMQNAMSEVNRWNAEHGYPTLTTGIGICTGNCVVGNIGSDDKMKYGCVGESVNLAGRVESQTVGDQVLITESTAALLAGQLTILSEYRFLPKGSKMPVTVYDILAFGSEHRLNRTTEETTWKKLNVPPVVPFYLLNEDKSVNPECMNGEISSISSDNRMLLLNTQSLPAFHQNVLIDIGGNLYGKVVGNEDEAAVIYMTSKPNCFDRWLESLQ